MARTIVSRSSFVTLSRRISLVDIRSLAFTGTDCGRKPGGTSTFMKLPMASEDIVRMKVMGWNDQSVNGKERRCNDRIGE